MANKENQPPASTAPLLSSISPNDKPALSRQRDHSACRRPDTPLKVRKTRENLKQHSIYADIPPPCVHTTDYDDHQTCTAFVPATFSHTDGYVLSQIDNALNPQTHTVNEASLHTVAITPSVSPPAPSLMQRQKSVSRRMLSRVKQGITSRPKASQSIRPIESETSLLRRLSGRRQQSLEEERRSQSFEVGRASTESRINEIAETVSLAAASIQRSFTDSTVSTAEVLGESTLTETPKHQWQSFETALTLDRTHFQSSSPPLQSSPSPQPTPRPPPKQEPPPARARPVSNTSLTVPCVDLYVALESSSVDIRSKRDIWVAIEATVRSMSTKVHIWNPTDSGVDNRVELESAQSGRMNSARSLSTYHERPSNTLSNPLCGTVSSLRLCFKPVEGCIIRDIVGQKTLKTLTQGQQCSLFIKLRVPKIRVRDSVSDPDQESLFTELESIVGTLKTEILHVEARYRHTLLPSDNVVSVRHICRIKRPKTDSRWSVPGHSEEMERPTEAYVMLARYLTSQYSSNKALELLSQYLSPNAIEQPAVCQIFNSLDLPSGNAGTQSTEHVKPSVVVTDIDIDSGKSCISPSESFLTAPSTPLDMGDLLSKPFMDVNNDHHPKPSSYSLVPPSKLAPPLISAQKTTTTLNIHDASPIAMTTQADVSSDCQDSARQLWRHIRRTSLSAKQLEEMTPERLHHLEAGDETLKELRQKALANKRSIGAETLREWKWNGSVQDREKHGEAPWM